jgi:hypothetical protein
MVATAVLRHQYRNRILGAIRKHLASNPIESGQNHGSGTDDFMDRRRYSAKSIRPSALPAKGPRLNRLSRGAYRFLIGENHQKGGGQTKKRHLLYNCIVIALGSIDLFYTDAKSDYNKEK